MLPIAILPRLDPTRLPLFDTEASPSLHWRDGETLHRMANDAERDGVRILSIVSTGQHIAVPHRDDGSCHLESLESCSCRYYRVWGRCAHQALLLSPLGQIPDAPRELRPAVSVSEPAPHLRRVM